MDKRISISIQIEDPENLYADRVYLTVTQTVRIESMRDLAALLAEVQTAMERFTHRLGEYVPSCAARDKSAKPCLKDQGHSGTHASIDGEF